MGCIIAMDFQQPNPLVFSALIVFFIILKIDSQQQTPSRKDFYSSAGIAVIIIFCTSLLGIICGSPCEYPCDIYSDLKEKDEFYIFIAWQAIVKTVLILMAIRLCKFIFIDEDYKEETTEIKTENFFIFIAFCFKVFIWWIFLFNVSQLSILFEFSLTADQSGFSQTSWGNIFLELYIKIKSFFDYS